jgi:hypothetical protein
MEDNRNVQLNFESNEDVFEEAYGGIVTCDHSVVKKKIDVGTVCKDCGQCPPLSNLPFKPSVFIPSRLLILMLPLLSVFLLPQLSVSLLPQLLVLLLPRLSVWLLPRFSVLLLPRLLVLLLPRLSVLCCSGCRS